MGKIKDGVPVFDVEGRAGYVYVRIRNQNGAQTSPPARNDPGVAHSENLPVRMRMEGTTLVIDSEVRREDLATTPAPPGSGVPVHIHDTRYFTEAEHINVSAGAADAGKPIKLNASGEVDPTMIDLTGVDIGAVIHAAAVETTPLDADETAILDSGASFALKRITWTTIKAFLKTYFDTLYELAGAIATHAALTVTHGATGAIVGTTNTQTLTNKTLTTPTIADFTNAQHDHGDADDGGAIANNAVLTAMIADAQVTLAKMANLAADTMIGRANGAGTGVPQALTATQVIAILQSGLDLRYGQLAAANTWTLLQTFSSGIVSATVDGSIAANGDLTLQGTTHATRTTSYVLLQPNGGHVGVGTTTPGVDVVGTFDFTSPTYQVLQLDGAQARHIVRGSTNSAFDFIHTGAATDEKWFSLQNQNGLVRMLSLTDAVALGFVFVAFDMTTGDVGIGTETPAAKLDVLQPTLGSAVQKLSSTATNTDPSEIVYQARVATTDGTQTTLHTFTVPASTTYMIEATVVARRTGGTAGTAEDGLGYRFIGTFKNVAGVATQIGQTNLILHESQGAFSCVFDVTGATVRCRVTGALDNSISWNMTARVWAVST